MKAQENAYKSFTMKRRRSYNAETPSSLSSDFSATEISPSPTIECFFNDHTYEDDIDDLNVAPCKDDPTQTCCQSDANFCYVTALHFIDDPCYPICWNSTIKDSGSPELDGKPMRRLGKNVTKNTFNKNCLVISHFFKKNDVLFAINPNPCL